MTNDKRTIVKFIRINFENITKIGCNVNQSKLYTLFEYLSLSKLTGYPCLGYSMRLERKDEL